MDWDVVVVGAGAAGLVAAERCGTRGRKTLLLEKNPRMGIKILMSGGTRCNLTQATDSRGIVAAYGTPGKFLHSALAALGPQDLVALVEDEGVPTKREATGKIFPVSDDAADILRAFVARLERSGCEVSLEEPLLELNRQADGFQLITNQRTISAAHVIITSGGQSYPGSGTAGDGYQWAQHLGHSLVPPRPALVPITTSAPWVRSLSGVTIPDVALQLWEPGEKSRLLDTRRGSMLFTHFGLSGPVVLDISRHVSGHAQPQSLWLECDFLPTVKLPELENRLRAQALTQGKKLVAALVPEEIPRRLAELLLREAAIAPDHKAGELSNAKREALVAAIKRMSIPITGTRGFGKAEVTAGGVPLAEVNSSTMQSKLVPGLYLAGEVLDLDGPIGGYNFQAAFSTGWLAGMNA